MSTGTEARHLALRQAVLEVMERRIAASGLFELGMRGIAEAVGCSPAMIYKLGVDHDELVLSVNGRTLDAIGAALKQAVLSADGPRSAMRGMGRAYVAFAQENTPRWDALFSHRMAEGRPVPDWYAAKRDSMLHDLAVVVAQAVNRGPGEAAEAFARLLFSAVHGVVTLGLQQKIGRVSPEMLRAQVDALVEVMAAGIEAQPC